MARLTVTVNIGKWDSNAEFYQCISRVLALMESEKYECDALIRFDGETWAHEFASPLLTALYQVIPRKIIVLAYFNNTLSVTLDNSVTIITNS